MFSRGVGWNKSPIERYRSHQRRQRSMSALKQLLSLTVYGLTRALIYTLVESILLNAFS